VLQTTAVMHTLSLFVLDGYFFICRVVVVRKMDYLLWNVGHFVDN